jgi:hypothetical protein
MKKFINMIYPIPLTVKRSVSTLRFSARTFIRMTTWIMQIVLANGLPTTGKWQEFEIML